MFINETVINLLTTIFIGDLNIGDVVSMRNYYGGYVVAKDSDDKAGYRCRYVGDKALWTIEDKTSTKIKLKNNENNDCLIQSNSKLKTGSCSSSKSWWKINQLMYGDEDIGSSIRKKYFKLVNDESGKCMKARNDHDCNADELSLDNNCNWVEGLFHFTILD